MNICNANIIKRFDLLAYKFGMNSETDSVDNGQEHILLKNISTQISPFNHDYADSRMHKM